MKNALCLLVGLVLAVGLASCSRSHASKKPPGVERSSRSAPLAARRAPRAAADTGAPEVEHDALRAPLDGEMLLAPCAADTQASVCATIPTGASCQTGGAADPPPRGAE